MPQGRRRPPSRRRQHLPGVPVCTGLLDPVPTGHLESYQKRRTHPGRMSLQTLCPQASRTRFHGPRHCIYPVHTGVYCAHGTLLSPCARPSHEVGCGVPVLPSSTSLTSSHLYVPCPGHLLGLAKNYETLESALLLVPPPWGIKTS